MNEIFFLISLTTLYCVACYPRSNRYCWACIITYPVLVLLLGLLITSILNFLSNFNSKHFTILVNWQPIHKSTSRVLESFFQSLRNISLYRIHDRPADGGFKTSAYERVFVQIKCYLWSPLWLKVENRCLAFSLFTKKSYLNILFLTNIVKK